MTLFPTNESKEKLKKYEELISKLKDLIRQITKNVGASDGGLKTVV